MIVLDNSIQSTFVEKTIRDKIINLSSMRLVLLSDKLQGPQKPSMQIPSCNQFSQVAKLGIILNP